MSSTIADGAIIYSSFAATTSGNAIGMAEMPDNYYRVAFVTYTFGAVLLLFCAVCAVPSLCCMDGAHQKCVHLVARLQVIAGG